jgi:hypothetical protein
MSRLWYFITTLAESGLSVFGIRTPYEQPAYQVIQRLSPAIEIRHYDARMAVETGMTDGNDGEAFGRLFRYITGANAPKKMIAMTAPVAEQRATVPMTMPIETSGNARTMRFFLPHAVVSAGVPTPTDPLVHIVAAPAATLAVIRFTGIASPPMRAQETALLREGLLKAGKPAGGAPIFLSYDPPFTIPFLRRNEVAIPCS